MHRLQGRKVRGGKGKEVGSHPVLSAAFSFPTLQLQCFSSWGGRRDSGVLFI